MQRLEGLAKLTGRERYVDDLPVTDFLWGMTVRSPVARGTIRSITFDPAFDWAGFTKVTAADIPGGNQVYLLEKDQPVLAAGEVRHMHEPIVLLAHESRLRVRQALAHVKVEIEPLPAIFDPLAAPTPAQVQHGEANVLKSLAIHKGNVEAVFARAVADGLRIIEGEYRTAAQEHVYIEPNGMIAHIDAGGVIVVEGSMQCPFYVLNAMKHAFGRDEKGVRIVQTPTGGGFGGKEDYPSVLAIHAALLALKSGRKVKMIYDRGEDMAATTKRHPSIVRHRTAVSPDGMLLAQDIEVVLDGGAYVTLSPVVLSRGLIHAAGPYSCANVRIRGRAMLTNCVPHGAFRGFGAPQTHFANERHMDRIARALGLAPEELRRKNAVVMGGTTATGQVIRDGVLPRELLAMLEEQFSLAARRQADAAHNAAHPFLKRGVGIATFHHGAGFTGSGEVYLASKLSIAGLPSGRIEVRSASTEMGQGTNTIFTLIAARHLGLLPADIDVATPDTANVPNSGPTVASRTAMVVGKLIEEACDDLRAKVGMGTGAAASVVGGTTLKAAIARAAAANGGEPIIGTAQYHKPEFVTWDDKTYQGDAYATFSWGAYATHVQVDTRTGIVEVLDFLALQDIGTVLHPTLAAGQVQGGVVQAIGWALMEECIWHDGGMKNNSLTNYIIPTSFDLPPIAVKFVGNHFALGGGGAKGVGELPMDGPAPAILNAVADATGIDPCEIPLTPERVMKLLMLQA